MKRRQFVQYSTATTLGALLIGSSGGYNFRESEIDSLLAHPDLLRFIGDDYSIHQIGREYRVVYEEEDDAQLLRDQIVNGLGPYQQLSRDVLKQQISADFDSGEVVCLKGWVLSITEARQCALFSLLHT